MIRNLPIQPLLSYISEEKIEISPQTIAILQEGLSDDKINKFSKPELLALALAQKYLENMMLTETTIPFFEFYSYKKDFRNQGNDTGGEEILMDATSLTTLDIFSAYHDIKVFQSASSSSTVSKKTSPTTAD